MTTLSVELYGMAVVRTTYFSGEIIIGIIILSHCECVSHVVTSNPTAELFVMAALGRAFCGDDFSGTRPCDNVFVLESVCN